MASVTVNTTTAPNGAKSLAGGPRDLKIKLRPWDSRGHANHGWLYTFHTFSFASYYDPSHAQFGPLRVINEDRVEKGTGFGEHPHADFLIWSYIVNGELEHKDSLGNVETLERGDVQFTKAGRGVRHSEYNRNNKLDNHFLQIWAKPDARGGDPRYVTRRFDDTAKTDNLVRIMDSVGRSPAGDLKGAAGEPISLEADLAMSASILTPRKTVEHELVAEGPRKVFLQVVMSGRTQPEVGGAAIKFGDTVIREGDGAYVEGAHGPGKLTIESVGDKPAEFLLFDMGM